MTNMKIKKTGVMANRDYSNPDDIIDALIDLAEKINEIIEYLNQKSAMKKKIYCGGDHCSGLWNLPCSDPEHPKTIKQSIEWWKKIKC